MKKIITSLVLIFALVIVFIIIRKPSPAPTPSTATNVDIASDLGFQGHRFRHFNIDISQASIPLDEILPGGPGKDGIPALTNPMFISVSEATEEGLDDEVQGIFLNSESGGKFYPYTILVWHEIVNDTVDGVPVAVTFCPLCGSAITYDRRINHDEVVEFGVSGFLWESNMIMYSRSADESFWSQTRGEAVVGSRVGTELDIVPMSVLSFAEVQKFHPDARVVSTDTGYDRNYTRYPYGKYETNEDIIFPISINDNRFHAKELFYVIPTEEFSLAIQESEISQQASVSRHQGYEFSVQLLEDGTIEVRGADNEVLPGYYEMWFSWAIHHQDDGVVWEF